MTKEGEIAGIDRQIDLLKTQLIRLTQQKDKLTGNPVAERMKVIVDVMPSPISYPKPIAGGADDLGEYDPRIIQMAKKTEKLRCDLRCHCK